MPKYLLETGFYVFSLILLLLFAFCVYTHNESILWITLGSLALFALMLYPKMLFWCLICAIPFSIEYTLGNRLSIDFPDEIFMVTSVGVFFFVILLNYQKNIRSLLQNPLILLLLLQLVWSILAAVNSQVPVLSVKYLLAKIWYIVPFVVVPQIIFKDKKSLQILGWCIMIPAIAGILYTMFRHSAFNFSFISINASARPIFRNHVTYAASISIAFSVLLVCIFYFKTKVPRGILALLAALFIAALFFSYTRGTWVSILCSWIAIFFFYKKWIRQMLVLLLLGISFGIGYLIMDNNYYMLKPKYNETIFHADFSEHLHAMYALKEISTSERIYRWVAGINMSTEHPMNGFGPSTFYSTYKKYTDKRFETYVSGNPEKSTVHNYFLLTLVEQGFPGLVILLLLVFSFYIRCEYLFHHIRDRFYKGVLLILCLVMTNILVVNFFSDMIETDKIGTMYFLCFGLLIWLESRWRQGAFAASDFEGTTGTG